ncbi:MAG: hypothetical protein COT74_00700 [Bdellovibrionales bacterium CG10_big_fil_rev_8_21_14_0_10_45_34]|nr:MAG: hypothetical protein COT74_00700 [Bdellovibrionales bacterium CG10_big_fil_rev_8_21_14_0_10_45_34]
MAIQQEQNFSAPEFFAHLIKRDKSAIEKVVRAYTEHLYRGALGLGFSPDAAAEVVQSVWVTFFEVVSNFEGRSHIRTFIFGILYNKASEMRKDQGRYDDSDPIEEVLDRRFDSNGHWLRPPVDPEQFMITSQTMELINSCIDRLPVSQRMAFCLKEIDDHGSKDICNILGVSVTNLGVLLFRAKNRLRECIESKGPKQA